RQGRHAAHRRAGRGRGRLARRATNHVSGTTLPGEQVMDTTRRDFLMKIGIALNVVAATLIAVPVVGYIAAALRKRSYQAWVKLGPMSDFPAGQTRLATYQNPFTVPWDGKTSNVACWVRHMGENKLQVFAVNCAHLGCPVRWFPESKLFMC